MPCQCVLAYYDNPEGRLPKGSHALSLPRLGGIAADTLPIAYGDSCTDACVYRARDLVGLALEFSDDKRAGMLIDGWRG